MRTTNWQTLNNHSKAKVTWIDAEFLPDPTKLAICVAIDHAEDFILINSKTLAADSVHTHTYIYIIQDIIYGSIHSFQNDQLWLWILSQKEILWIVYFASQFSAVGGAEVIPVTSSVCAKCSETWKPGDRLATGPFSRRVGYRWMVQPIELVDGN